MIKCICGDLVENHDSEGCGNPRCFCVLDRADAATSVPLSELTTLRADLAAREADVARLRSALKLADNGLGLALTVLVDTAWHATFATCQNARDAVQAELAGAK